MRHFVYVWWWSLRNAVRRAYRRVRGHCVLCDRDKALDHQHAPNTLRCMHCATVPEYCHRCNKMLNFGKLYGAGPRTLQRLRQQVSR